MQHRRPAEEGPALSHIAITLQWHDARGEEGRGPSAGHSERVAIGLSTRRSVRGAGGVRGAELNEVCLGERPAPLSCRCRRSRCVGRCRVPIRPRASARHDPGQRLHSQLALMRLRSVSLDGTYAVRPSAGWVLPPSTRAPAGGRRARWGGDHEFSGASQAAYLPRHVYVL